MGKLKAPFFEFGPKTYLWGSKIVDMALYADEFSDRYNVDVIFTVQVADIEKIKHKTSRLKVFAQHSDFAVPGIGMGIVLPEVLADCGADGVMLNHSEKPIHLRDVLGTICRAKENSLMTILCAGSLEEAKACAIFSPDVILYEEPNLIGGGIRGLDDFNNIPKINQELKKMNFNGYIMHAAGVVTYTDVYKIIKYGADGTGSTSAIIKSDAPEKTLEQMILNVRKAYDERRNK